MADTSDPKSDPLAPRPAPPDEPDVSARMKLSELYRLHDALSDTINRAIAARDRLNGAIVHARKQQAH